MMMVLSFVLWFAAVCCMIAAWRCVRAWRIQRQMERNVQAAMRQFRPAPVGYVRQFTRYDRKPGIR